MRWLALILLIACGGAQHPAHPPLAIAELRLYEGNEMVEHLLADGTLQVLEKGKSGDTEYEEWKTVGVLRPDSPLPAGVHFEGEALDVNGKRLTLSAQGSVLLDGKPLGDGKLVHFVGANDPATRRTALVVLALTLH